MKWTELKVLVGEEDKAKLHELIAMTEKNHGIKLSLSAVASSVIHGSLSDPTMIKGDSTNALTN